MTTMTCPLCDAQMVVATFGDHACAQCGLAGSLAILTAIARLRVQGDRRTRKSVDAYRERNRCVAAIAWLALRNGMRAGLGRHTPDPDPSWDPEWLSVVYVELPTGQVSWHVPDSCMWLFEGLPSFDPGWDGHTLNEKYRRLDSLKSVAVTSLDVPAIAAALGLTTSGPTSTQQVLDRIAELQERNRELLARSHGVRRVLP